MDQAGVEVRPLRQVNGDLHFNEVFMEEATVDEHDRIAAEGEGWAVRPNEPRLRARRHGRHRARAWPASSAASS